MGNFYIGFRLSLALCAFNLFPVLPLDGGRILVSILPKDLSEKYAGTEKFGFVILMFLFFVLPSVTQTTGNAKFDILSSYMAWMQEGLLNIIDFIV